MKLKKVLRLIRDKIEIIQDEDEKHDEIMGCF
jgi:hypothetical protein